MLQLHRSFSPLRPSFQPKYLRRDVAVLGSIEEKARHLGIGLGFPKIELLTVMLTQRLRIYPNNPGDIGFRDAIGGQCFNLAALRGIRSVGAPPHQPALSTCRSAATSANDLPAPSSVAFSPVKACQRSTATSMYAGSISIANQQRPVIAA